MTQKNKNDCFEISNWLLKSLTNSKYIFNWILLVCATSTRKKSWWWISNIVLYRRNHEGWNLTLVALTTRRQSLLWSDMDKKSKLARQLYPSLPNWEIALLSGTWAFSIAYALSRVLLLSRGKSASAVIFRVMQIWEK